MILQIIQRANYKFQRRLSFNINLKKFIFIEILKMSSTLSNALNYSRGILDHSTSSVIFAVGGVVTFKRMWCKLVISDEFRLTNLMDLDLVIERAMLKDYLEKFAILK